jgi:hypothetical protein
MVMAVKVRSPREQRKRLRRFLRHHFRQLIHQFIQIPDFLSQRIFDFLYPITTDDGRDEVCIWG